MIVRAKFWSLFTPTNYWSSLKKTMMNNTIIIPTFYRITETVALLKRWSRILCWVQVGYCFEGYFVGQGWVQLSLYISYQYSWLQHNPHINTLGADSMTVELLQLAKQFFYTFQIFYIASCITTKLKPILTLTALLHELTSHTKKSRKQILLYLLIILNFMKSFENQQHFSQL